MHCMQHLPRHDASRRRDWRSFRAANCAARGTWTTLLTAVLRTEMLLRIHQTSSELSLWPRAGSNFSRPVTSPSMPAWTRQQPSCGALNKDALVSQRMEPQASCVTALAHVQLLLPFMRLTTQTPRQGSLRFAVRTPSFDSSLCLMRRRLKCTKTAGECCGNPP